MKYWLPYVTVEHPSGIEGRTADDAQADLIHQYMAYFNTIKDKLPPDILKFADRGNSYVYLNDGHIQWIKSDFAAGEVELRIDGHVSEQGKLGWGMITLHYEGVSRFDYIDSIGRRRHDGIGDHLFDEIELISDHTFKHSMYFEGDIEIAITFGGFSLSYGELDFR